MAVVQDNKATRVVSIPGTGGGGSKLTVTAHTYCRRITVGENFTSAAGPTTDLGKAEPVGAGQVIVPKGTPCVFTAPGPNGSYSPGQKAGTVVALDVAGPVEGQQTEDQLI